MTEITNKPRYEARKLIGTDEDGEWEILTDEMNDPIEGDDLDEVISRAKEECEYAAEEDGDDVQSILVNVYIAKVEVTGIFPWGHEVPSGSSHL